MGCGSISQFTYWKQFKLNTRQYTNIIHSVLQWWFWIKFVVAFLANCDTLTIFVGCFNTVVVRRIPFICFFVCFQTNQFCLDRSIWSIALILFRWLFKTWRKRKTKLSVSDFTFIFLGCVWARMNINVLMAADMWWTCKKTIIAKKKKIN